MAKGETFVGQVVHQRLPAAVRVAAAQQSADQTVHFGRGETYPFVGSVTGLHVVIQAFCSYRQRIRHRWEEYSWYATTDPVNQNRLVSSHQGSL